MSEIDRSTEKVNQLARTARGGWLSLLTFAAFIFVTLLGVVDADFFVPSRRTDLPLINVSIPTIEFFRFAPLLASALYANLHFHLMKLWDALTPARAPAYHNSRHFSDRIAASFIADMALALRPDKALRPRPMRYWMAALTFALVFVATPAILAAFWWRSMPAHDEWLTVAWIGIPFLFSAIVGITSLSHLWRAVRGTDPMRRLSGPGGAAILVAAVTAIGWMRTEGWAEITTYLAPADLRGVDLVGLPEGWLDYETAREHHRRAWCKENGVPLGICGEDDGLTEEDLARRTLARGVWCTKRFGIADAALCDAEFASHQGQMQQDWQSHRAIALAKVPGLDLRGKDLRGANLSRARMEGADLSEARMEGADLSDARMEGANLRWARMEGAILWLAWMEGANLRWARMEGADLFGARMEGAILSRARMEGAILSRARMEGADLSDARMEGADLSEARMEGADLSDARMEGADLRWARMEGANLIDARFDENTNFNAAVAQYATVKSVDLSMVNLSQDQVNTLFGDASVTLPDGPDGLDRPAHWPDADLDIGIPFPSLDEDSDFAKAWRAWQKAEGYAPN